MAKFPFVSRSAYDAALASGESTVAALLAALDRERDRYDRLVERMADMQRAGFKTPDPLPEPTTPPRLPGIVEAAITAHMDPRGPMGRRQTELAFLWLGEGQTPERVAQRIHAGADADG